MFMLYAVCAPIWRALQRYVCIQIIIHSKLMKKKVKQTEDKPNKKSKTQKN